MKSTTDLLNLRWRVAQWFLALSDGETEQAAALLKAMRVEGIEKPDLLDEFGLLRAEFGNRPRYRLAAEISRVWGKLRERCVRCEKPTRYRDNAGVCYRCIVGELP